MSFSFLVSEREMGGGVEWTRVARRELQRDKSGARKNKFCRRLCDFFCHHHFVITVIPARALQSRSRSPHPFSLPSPPHRHQRNGSTTLVCQLRRPSSPFLLECQEASESVRERASATESLLSFASSTVRECCQRASASGHRMYVLGLGSSARPLCCGGKDFASRPVNTVWLKTLT